MSKQINKGFYSMMAITNGACADTFNTDNCRVIYEANGEAYRSWVPGRSPNNFDNFQPGVGYIVVSKGVIDLTGLFADITDLGVGGVNTFITLGLQTGVDIDETHHLGYSFTLKFRDAQANVLQSKRINFQSPPFFFIKPSEIPEGTTEALLSPDQDCSFSVVGTGFQPNGEAYYSGGGIYKMIKDEAFKHFYLSELKAGTTTLIVDQKDGELTIFNATDENAVAEVITDNGEVGSTRNIEPNKSFKIRSSEFGVSPNPPYDNYTTVRVTPKSNIETEITTIQSVFDGQTGEIIDISTNAKQYIFTSFLLQAYPLFTGGSIHCVLQEDTEKLQVLVNNSTSNIKIYKALDENSQPTGDVVATVAPGQTKQFALSDFFDYPNAIYYVMETDGNYVNTAILVKKPASTIQAPFGSSGGNKAIIAAEFINQEGSVISIVTNQ